MSVIQTQGVNHITVVGSNREAIIEFYQGLLGMPLVFSQPNLDVPEEEHLFFDPGDGRLLTFFVRPDRTDDPTANPEGIGYVQHLAFTVSRDVFAQATERLNESGIEHSDPIDRGIVDSIYFRDPNGQLLELACFKCAPPKGFTMVDVVRAAHRIRVSVGDTYIEQHHVDDAMAQLRSHP